MKTLRTPQDRVVVWWALAIAACAGLDWLTTRVILATGGYEADAPMRHLLSGPLWGPLLIYKAAQAAALLVGALLAMRFMPRLTRPYMAAAVLVAAAAPVWNALQIGQFLLMTSR